MKRFFPRRARGTAFTLVELLVVMGIIAILAGVIVASVGSVLRYAKRTKANSTAAMLQTAVQSYYTEYSVYPTQSGYPGTGDAYYDGGTTSATGMKYLMIALCGNVNPLSPGTTVTGNAVTNTRGIPYLQPNRSDLDTTYGIFVNPFGKASAMPYYAMAIDTDYSGVVGDNGDAANKLPNLAVYSTNYTGTSLSGGTPGGVAVWCACDQPLTGGTAAKPSPGSFWAHTY